MSLSTGKTDVTNESATNSPKSWTTMEVWSFALSKKLINARWIFSAYDASGIGHKARLEIGPSIPADDAALLASVGNQLKLTVKFSNRRTETLFVDLIP
jgi:hypothetical protein